MAPTKPTGSSAWNPIDLTDRPAPVPATPTAPATPTGTGTGGSGVISGRISKSTPSKSTPTKAAKKAAIAAGSGSPNAPKRGRASGPSCLPCRRAKARCDRIMACERCLKAGKECTPAAPAPGAAAAGAAAGGAGGGPAGADEEEGAASASAAAAATAVGGKVGKACERCRRMKAACVRRDTCVRCEKRGGECEMA
ncbi:hypothetical protein B0I37DRAFT_412998 [Chaetomium sp. MPI-CAGE-AT-0009]|nr:hypothetical protein B0I37DRAFT_412998 [Chaetomium sp. MPI-CAGE-AT-0009]